MPYSIDVSRDTYEKLALAARMTNTTLGEIVARAIASASAEPSTRVAPSHPAAAGPPEAVAVQAIYEGHLTTGLYHPASKRIEISSGPLSGQSFKTPSAAARAVIESLNPRVNSNRNGWSFWLLTGSGEALQTIRY